MTTLILTFNRSIGWACDKCGTFRFFSSAISVGTFIWWIDWALYDRVTLLNAFYTVSLRAFNWTLFRATSSCTAFISVIHAFTVPTVILSFLANSYYTLLFWFCTTVVWTSNSVQRTTVDCWAHKNTISAFSSGTNNLISAFSAVNGLIRRGKSSSWLLFFRNFDHHIAAVILTRLILTSTVVDGTRNHRWTVFNGRSAWLIRAQVHAWVAFEWLSALKFTECTCLIRTNDHSNFGTSNSGSTFLRIAYNN